MSSSAEFTFVDSNNEREQAHRRKNPDGSVGGWVAESAQVHPTAIVEIDAIVEPGAIVEEGVTVLNGAVVLADDVD